MNENIEQKLVSVLDALQNGAVEIGGKIVKYAPDIADTALLVTRLDGIDKVVTNALLATFGAFAACYLWKKAKKMKGDPYDHDKALYIIAVIVGLTALIPAFYVLNIWTWVQIFEPKLYIAKQIIDSALQAGGAK